MISIAAPEYLHLGGEPTIDPRAARMWSLERTLVAVLTAILHIHALNRPIEIYWRTIIKYIYQLGVTPRYLRPQSTLRKRPITMISARSHHVDYQGHPQTQPSWRASLVIAAGGSLRVGCMHAAVGEWADMRWDWLYICKATYKCPTVIESMRTDEDDRQ
jgi:hypothetical protein